MLRVGKYEVLQVVSLLIPAGEEATLQLAILGGNVDFKIRFLVAEEPNERSKLWINSGPDPEDAKRGLITLTNWNRPTLTTNGKPAHVVTVGETLVYFICAVSFSNDVYNVRLQFMTDHSTAGKDEANEEEDSHD